MSDLEAAVIAVELGSAVVIPTDTVYGLAASPFAPGATARLFEIKGRPAGLALPVLVSGLAQARTLADRPFPATALRLAEAFWPGGLTLVVQRRPDLNLDLGGDGSTVGLRQPDNQTALELCGRVGPLATTSANRHGEPTPTTSAEVAEALGTGVAVVVDGGVCAGAPSTVVDCTGAELRLLREGRVAWPDVLAALEPAGGRAG